MEEYTIIYDVVLVPEIVDIDTLFIIKEKYCVLFYDSSLGKKVNHPDPHPKIIGVTNVKVVDINTNEGSRLLDEYLKDVNN